MHPERIRRIQSSFNALAHRAEEIADRFFAQLFAEQPAMRALFPRHIADQKRCFVAVFVYVVKNLRDIDNIRQPLIELGRRQVAYGMKPEHPAICGDVLARVLRDVVGGDWNDELRADWTEAIDTARDIILAGANKAAFAPLAC